MMIVALDLATVTGIAIGDTAGKPIGMTEQLGEVGGRHGARFTYALRLATNLILDFKPDLVVIEEPIAHGPVGDKNRLMMLMGLRSIVFCACDMRKIRVAEYPVNSIRSHFIGKASLPSAQAKAATMARCARLGWQAANHNEADAMAVWDLARSKMRHASSPTPNGLFDLGT